MNRKILKKKLINNNDKKMRLGIVRKEEKEKSNKTNRMIGCF